MIPRDYALQMIGMGIGQNPTGGGLTANPGSIPLSGGSKLQRMEHIRKRIPLSKELRRHEQRQKVIRQAMIEMMRRNM
jgi:hypothetical protein